MREYESRDSCEGPAAEAAVRRQAAAKYCKPLTLNAPQLLQCSTAMSPPTPREEILAAFFAGDFFAAGFFAGDFLAAVFFLAGLFAFEAGFAGLFLAAGFLGDAAFFAGDLCVDR